MQKKSQYDIEKETNKSELNLSLKDLLRNNLYKDKGGVVHVVIQALLNNANDGLTLREWGPIFGKPLIRVWFDTVRKLKSVFSREKPPIRIWFDVAKSQLIIQDNGIGMDLNGLKHIKHELDIISTAHKFETDYTKIVFRLSPFISALVIADHFVIESRRKGHPGYRLKSQDQQTYNISELSDINYGMKVVLELGSEILKDWDSDKIKDLTTQIARNLTFPVLWGSEQLKVPNEPLFSVAPSSNQHESQELSFAKDHLIFTIEGEQRLTPQLLGTSISSFLRAISDVQRIVDEIRTGNYHEIIITEITQKSPISVSLEGASEAIGLIKDTVVPWRRKHAETMAKLSEQEKQAEIELKKAEILEKRAQAEKERLEASKQRVEAERLRLENEKLRIELQRAKVQLAIEILSQIAPNLSETDKVANVVRLLSPLDVIIFSELEISKK